MATEVIKVPDIGGAENVDVIEVCVAPGDMIEVDQSLAVLESDKASMEIPSTQSGKVVSVSIKEGDQVSEGDAVLELEVGGAAAQPAPAAEPAPAPAPVAATSDMPLTVPDIGGAEGVDVIELCVAVGDDVAEGDSLIVLESDKASMEIPAPSAGKIASLAVQVGDKVSEGDAIGSLSVSGGAVVASAPAPQAAPAPASAAPAGEQQVAVPDIGGAEGVDVIELCVAVGDDVSEGDSLIVLESDKASMEIPSPFSGKVLSLAVKEGDKVSEGDAVASLAVAGAAPAPAPAAPQVAAPAPAAKPAATPVAAAAVAEAPVAGGEVYAGPAVRKLARELGVDLKDVKPTGPRGRMSKDDLHNYVKQVMAEKRSGGGAVTSGSGIPAIPEVDFSQFGEIELVKMSKIKKVTALNMSRNWLNIPHVTQWDDADISDLEAFRKGLKPEAEKRGVKLTPLPFLIKACAMALRQESSFNVSMHADGEHIVQKHYVNIGIAADTPNGLMVPVLRDADKKGIYQLAEEATGLIIKARDGKLGPKDMQGGCFTISSLGAMGGKGFTPIVNAPEVAILGVSKASVQPVWNGSDFEPRTMLPLSLSYDHRAVNGADAGRFFTYLTSVLADIRRLML